MAAHNADNSYMQKIFLRSLLVGGLAVGAYYLLTRNKTNCKGKTEGDLVNCILEEISDNIGRSAVHLKTEMADAGRKMDTKVTAIVEHIKDRLFSKEMKESISSVSTLLEKLTKFDKEAKEYSSPLFLLIAVVRQIQELDLNKVQHALGQPTLPPSRVFSHKRYGGYALNVYAASWAMSSESAAKTMSVDEDEVLMTHFKDTDGVHCPKFMLFKDSDEQAIVLAIRGTFSFKDVITDVICEETPFLGGFAHKGFLNGANKIMDLVEDTLIQTLKENPDFKFVVSGHSMGAGTAELIYLDYTLGPRRSRLSPDLEIECLALAPPPIFRSNSDLPEQVKSNIHIYVFNNDLVPRLSLGNVAKLLAIIRRLDDLEIPIYNLVSILSNRISEDEEEILRKIRAAILEVKQETFPYLDHPGNIFHLRRFEDNIRIFKAEPFSFSQSILILENMIVDHLQGSYEEGLQALPVPPPTY